jgi:hypothetical protein
MTMADLEQSYSWNELPAASASDDEWAAFKTRAFDELCDLVRKADRELESDPQARVERIHRFRREHHLIVVADRVRRSATAETDLSGRALREAAVFIVDRSAYVIEGRAGPRTRDEEKMIVSARVNWHKIMRKAQSRAGLQGGWGAGKPELRGSTQIFRKLTAPGLKPERRAALLRAHIEQRLQQLVDLVRETTDATRCKLPRQDRIIVHELENLLYRTQWSKRQKRGGGGGDEDMTAPETD